MTDEDYCEAVLSLLTLPLEELTGWERTVRHAWDHDGSTFRVGDAIVFEDGAHRYGYLCQPVGWSPLVGRGGRGSQAQDLEDIS